MNNIHEENPTDGSVPKCECGCGMPAFRNRWGWTKYRRGHSPKEEKVEKTLVPRKPKEHTDDSRPSLPIREVSHEEFDRMAKASDPTYKVPERLNLAKVHVELAKKTRLDLPLKAGDAVPIKKADPFRFPTHYVPSTLDGLDTTGSGTEEPAPSRTSLCLIATSLAAFLAGLIIGKKRTK